MTDRRPPPSRLTLVNRVADPALYRGDRRGHFLHVPKCGGTTVRYLIEAAADLMDLPVANEAGSFTTTRRGGPPVFSLAHNPPPDLFARDDTLYLTLLREPVDRARSLIGHSIRRTGGTPGAVIDRLTPAMLNHATWLLGTGPDGRPLDEALDTARQRLVTGLHLFGLQERFDEFAALVATFVGVEGLIFPPFQQRPADLHLTEAQERRLFDATAHDRALYEAAKDAYRHRFAPYFASGTHKARRLGVPYLAVTPNDDSGTVDARQIVFT